MSGEDNFLARWSRRKREVSEAEQSPLVPAAADASPAEGGDELPDPGTTSSEDPAQLGGEETPLPRVEDLTAESDLAAFLRPGVPEALKRAALRRVWSLDPAIRDFVGPAEYAWDFHNPEAMAGFAGAVRQLDLAGFFSGDPATPARLPAAEPTAPVRTAAASPAPALEEAAANPEPAQPRETEAADTQAGAAPEEGGGAGRPRHGGAAPR